MNESPLVSVCMPLYNKEEYVYESVKSVFDQTYQNWELIICDNASTDTSLERIANFLRDSRVKLYKNDENIGLVANFKRVLSLATGKYIKLVYADDVIPSTCLERQVRVLEDPKNDRVSLSVICRKIINENSRDIFMMPCRYKAGINDGRKAIKKCFFFGTNLIGEPHVAMFRRFDIETLPYADTDIGMWAFILEKGSLHVTTDIRSSFRICSNSLTTSMKLDYPKHYIELFDIIRRRMKFSCVLFAWFSFMCIILHFVRSFTISRILRNAK